MTDTTETGRGSRPWELGDVAAGLRRAFMDGAHWVSKMQTHEYLRDDIYKAMCLEVHRRYPDDDSQSRSGTGKVVAVKERPAMIVEDNESEWMVDLREMADPMIPHNWESRAPTARKAIDHIEAQEKEIEALNQEIDRLKAALEDPDDMACSPRDFLRTVAKLLKRTERAEAEVSYERERNANNVAIAEAEREDLRRRREDLRRRLDGLVEAADNVTEHYPYLVYVDKLKDVLAIARDEKEKLCQNGL